MKEINYSLGKMIGRVASAYLSIDLMLLLINLPFSSLVIEVLYDEAGNVLGTQPRVLPCIILGVFTLLIFFALMVGYMGPVGEKIKSPFNVAPVDNLLALKAAAIVFALPFAFSAFTALTGGGVFLTPSFYESMRFPHNVFYGPVFGFLQAFYTKSWLTPFFPPLVMVALTQLSYWIIMKGFKLPRIFYRNK